MAFNESTVVPFGVEKVLRALLDEQFNRSVTESLGGELKKFEASPAQPTEADAVSVAVERSLPVDRLPDVVKKFVKGGLDIEHEEAWQPASAGTRTAQMVLKVPVGKLTAIFTQSLQPVDQGTQITVAGEVECKIPMFGNQIAQRAEPMVGKVVARQARELEKWLKNQA